jgi:hypothetical protein
MVLPLLIPSSLLAGRAAITRRLGLEAGSLCDYVPFGRQEWRRAEGFTLRDIKSICVSLLAFYLRIRCIFFL